MQPTTFIYALCEPNSRTVRYLGKSNSPQRRLKQHMSVSSKCASLLGAWLRELISRNEVPNLVVLSEISIELWKKEEKLFIRAGRVLCMNLVNSTDGGEGVTMTPQTRAKIAAAHLGRKHSPATKTKLSAIKLGRKLPPFTAEHKARIGLANAGKNHGMFGRSHTVEARSAISSAGRARKHSLESKEKLRAAKLGNKNPMFGKKKL